MAQEDHQTADKNVHHSLNSTLNDSLILPAIPERKAGDFNSTGSTGIEVDLELQFGTDLKSEKLLQDFLTRFEKLKKSDSKAS